MPFYYRFCGCPGVEEDSVESLVVTLPIKLIDGQIYYNQHGEINDKIKMMVKRDLDQIEVIDLDSEVECSESRNEQQIYSTEVEPTVCSAVEREDGKDSKAVNDTDTSAKESTLKDVPVEDHGAEIPVVTTPIQNVNLDIDQCVADIICVLKSKQIQSDTIQGDESFHPDHSRLSPITKSDSSIFKEATAESGELVEERVLLDSITVQDADDGGNALEELAMGHEVIVSMEGSSQSFEYLDSNELISSLLLYSCLPKNGGRVSLS